MSGRYVSIMFSAELDAKVAKVAKELGVNHSAAVRILVGRSLGRGIARLMVDEKVQEVKNLMRKRIGGIINESFRQELHALVDEVNPPTVSALIGDESEVEVEAVEDEPVVESVSGRPRKAAKARRR